jgi:hypothetical protein
MRRQTVRLSGSKCRECEARAVCKCASCGNSCGQECTDLAGRRHPIQACRKHKTYNHEEFLKEVAKRDARRG